MYITSQIIKLPIVSFIVHFNNGDTTSFTTALTQQGTLKDYLDSIYERVWRQQNSNN